MSHLAANYLKAFQMFSLATLFLDSDSFISTCCTLDVAQLLWLPSLPESVKPIYLVVSQMKGVFGNYIKRTPYLCTLPFFHKSDSPI
jgi:hypothetical protein